MKTERIKVVRPFLVRRNEIPVNTVFDCPVVLAQQLKAASKAEDSSADVTANWDDIAFGRAIVAPEMPMKDDQVAMAGFKGSDEADESDSEPDSEPDAGSESDDRRQRGGKGRGRRRGKHQE